MAIMTQDEPRTGSALLEAARDLRPLIEANADQTERNCQLGEPVVEALAAAGLFTMLVPRELGGAQVDPLTYVRVVDELARADGSTSWCVMTGGVVGLAAGSLQQDAARQIWGNPRGFVAGAAARSGRAVVVDGGYRVSGRWPFASGCRNATYLLANAPVLAGGEPRLGPNAQPESRAIFVPVADAHIVENWEVLGLRGTGSHDFELDDLFVPEAFTLQRTYSVLRWHPDALYTLGAAEVAAAPTDQAMTSPWAGLTPPGMSAVVLGIARGALDAFAELAATRTRSKWATVLRDDPVVQDQFGRAEAKLRAARSSMHQTVADVWESVQATGVCTAEDQAMIRMTSAYAAETAVEVAETVWKLAGTAGIYTGSALDRRLRDVQVGAQNVALSPLNFRTSGQLLLKAMT